MEFDVLQDLLRSLKICRADNGNETASVKNIIYICVCVCGMNVYAAYQLAPKLLISCWI